MKYSSEVEINSGKLKQMLGRKEEKDESNGYKKISKKRYKQSIFRLKRSAKYIE